MGRGDAMTAARLEVCQIVSKMTHILDTRGQQPSAKCPDPAARRLQYPVVSKTIAGTSPTVAGSTQCRVPLAWEPARCMSKA